MRVVRDGIQLCTDCTLLACTGDASSLDYHYGKGADARIAECEAGLERLGAHLVPAFDSETGEGIHEFRVCRCDCCQSALAGERHEFAILGRDHE